MRSPGKNKTIYTRIFCHCLLGSDHFLECSTHVIVIGVYCFCSETFCISPGQVFISNNHNGKSRHVMKRHIMTWYCRRCANLVKETSLFSHKKYIKKTQKFNKQHNINRYFGTKIKRLKSRFAIFSGMSVTLFLENKQSYTQSMSYINTPCFCCQVALHSRWDLTFKAKRNETVDRLEIYGDMIIPHTANLKLQPQTHQV